MGMNKNTIFAWASFALFIIGAAIILLGVLKYREYAIGFSVDFLLFPGHLMR